MDAYKYHLSNDVILRKEHFGGILFNRRNAVTLEVDNELYALLLLLYSEKSIEGLSSAVKSDSFKIRSCMDKILKHGFICKANENDMHDKNPSAINRQQPDKTIDNCLSAPEMVHLSITNKCNQSCPFCYVRQTGDDMNTGEIMRLIDTLSEMKVFQVAIGGGEPFLRDDLFQIAAYCRKKGIVPNITTNGSMLDNSIIEKLTGIVGQINLSVNECIGSTDCTKAISMLKHAGIRVGVNLMVSHKNISLIENTISDLSALNVENIILLRPKPAKNRAWYLENKLNSSDIKMLKAALSPYTDIIRVDCSLVCLMQDIPSAVLEYRSVFGCVGGIRFCTIRNNGDVYPCSFFNETDGDCKEYLAGNVLSSDFRNIWRSAEIFKKFRTMNNKISGRCKECRIRDNCKGCRRIALEENHDFYSEGICISSGDVHENQ